MVVWNSLPDELRDPFHNALLLLYIALCTLIHEVALLLTDEQ